MAKYFDDSYYNRRGVIYSILGHLSIIGITLFSGIGFQELPEAPVYSVTLEGGKTLGGRAQVAKDDTKQILAPPKNVAEEKKVEKTVEEKKEEVKVEVKPLEKIEEKKVENDDRKEVVIEKKEEIKPTPVPTKAPVQNTPQPQTTPVAKKVESQNKETPKKETKEDVNKDYQKALQRYLGNSTDARGSGFGAGKLGGNGFGGGEVRPREFFIYLDLLKSKMKEGWTWYDSATVLVSTVQFSLSPTGEISGVRIAKSSGNGAFDDSVIRAIRQANPVPPPPANVYQYFKVVNIVFDPRS